MIKFIVVVVVLVLASIVLGIARTWQEEHSENQKLFSSGSAPNPMPDGFYSGSVPGHTFSWQGKKFFAASSTGINVFTSGSTTEEKYPFVTSIGKGVRDTTRDVLKIDYDIPSNPFWLRPILDEILQIAPGQYLGKLQLRIIPGFPFTLGYFELKK
jgi:hypothetical protein